MERQDKDSIQAFDALYTTNQIQVLKILLPFCAPDMRRSLTVMIKFMEFQYTLSFTQAHPDSFRGESPPFSLNDLCGQLKAYCSPQLVSMLEQFQSMQNAMQMYEEMKQMMDLFQEMDADGMQAAADGRGADVSAGDKTADTPGTDSGNDTDGKDPGKEAGKAGRDDPAGGNNAAAGDTQAGRPSGDGRNAFNPMSMLAGFLSPEQMEMFQSFQDNFGGLAGQSPPEMEE